MNEEASGATAVGLEARERGAQCDQYLLRCLIECGLYDDNDEAWLERNEGWVRSVGCHPGYESPMESLFGSARTRFLDMKSIAGSEGHLGELGRLCRELAIPVELINERMQVRAGRVFGLLRGIADLGAGAEELAAEEAVAKWNRKALARPLSYRSDEPPEKAAKRFGILMENAAALRGMWSTASERKGSIHKRRLALLQQRIEEEVQRSESPRLSVEEILKPYVDPGDLSPPRLFWWSPDKRWAQALSEKHGVALIGRNEPSAEFWTEFWEKVAYDEGLYLPSAHRWCQSSLPEKGAIAFEDLREAPFWGERVAAIEKAGDSSNPFRIGHGIGVMWRWRILLPILAHAERTRARVVLSLARKWWDDAGFGQGFRSTPRSQESSPGANGREESLASQGAPTPSPQGKVFKRAPGEVRSFLDALIIKGYRDPETTNKQICEDLSRHCGYTVSVRTVSSRRTELKREGEITDEE